MVREQYKNYDDAPKNVAAYLAPHSNFEAFQRLDGGWKACGCDHNGYSKFSPQPWCRTHPNYLLHEVKCRGDVWLSERGVGTLK